MIPALHYSAVGAAAPSSTIYGLQIAVDDWVRAYFRFGTAERFLFLVSDEASRDEVCALAKATGTDPARLAFMDSRFPRENLGVLPVVFRPDLDPHDLLWQRECAAAPGFAFCGLAHAIAGRAGGEILWKYVNGPSAPGDSIVCPSRAIRSMIQRFFESAAETVRLRFNGTFASPVDLPLIPLGVDAERIEARVSPEKRAAQRAALGIAEDETVLLWVGRLSAATKAHPIAHFRAAEEAAKSTGRKIRFVMQGYFIPEAAERDFEALAAAVCPSCRVTFVKRDDPRFPDGLWAAGDIFVSLIDNVQESFGLTPIEAIAAGLPRVISDWDGYRDSVTHGEDGFLIPTLQPAPGCGAELAELTLAERETYGVVLAKTALSVAVDAEAAAQAIAELVESPERRARMAEAAKRRLPTYAWRSVIAAYEAHWAESAAKRRATFRPAPAWPAIPPETPDPFTLYESFASAHLQPETRFACAASRERIKSLWSNPLNIMGGDMMLDPGLLTLLLNHVAAHPAASLSEIAAALPQAPAPRLQRTLVWLVKLGILKNT